ncbi:MAG: hypothetical protein AB7F86_08330 [Bdellovibrionales bacterium]
MIKSEGKMLGATIALLALGVAASFQSCGPKKSGGSPVQSASAQNNLPDINPAIPGPPGEPEFKRGDLFNFEYIPSYAQMIKNLMNVFEYYPYEGAKAVALAANGLGFVSRKKQGAWEDAKQAALEGCYVISGGQPCTLLAVGYNFVVDHDKLSSSFTFTIPQPSTVSGSTLPFLSLDIREAVANGYNAGALPRALAVSLDGAFSYVVNSTQSAIGSTAEAVRLAMERCEMAAALSPCILFSYDNQVVFNPKVLSLVAQIDYLRTTLSVNIPGLRDQVFSGPITSDYIAQVQGGKHGVIYLSADGRGAYSVNANAGVAESEAKQSCEAAQPVNRCFRYAVDMAIQDVRPNLAGVFRFGLDLHCKSVPRASCEEHKKMGCPPGTYYTTAQGHVDLENCNP